MTMQREAEAATAAAKETPTPSEKEVQSPAISAKIREKLKLFLNEFDFTSFWDVTKPWVLVPHGSFLNAFDWVPPVFREGHWNLLVCLHFAFTVYSVGLMCVYYVFTKPALIMEANSNNNADNNFEYYDAYSSQWWYNLAGFAWTSFVIASILFRGGGPGSWLTFTVQTWTLLWLRHGLSTLVSLWPSYYVVTLNEYLRLPMLVQSSLTFFAWNLILAPIIYSRMETPAQQQMFRNVFTNFRLTQLHLFVIVFATIQGVYGTPARQLSSIDFCCTCLSVLQYAFLYLLVLDRLGIHLYLIYSPRTNLAILSWSLTYAAVYGLFVFWRKILNLYIVEEPGSVS